MQQIYNFFDGFSDDSRVWIYTADRPLDPTEAVFVQENLDSFANQWKAHGSQLKAKARMMNEFTIVFVVDQDEAEASGCSVDSSVRFVKEIGKELSVDFFNRLNVLIETDNGERKLHPYRKLTDLPTGYAYYNPLVQTLKELKEEWYVVK